VVHWEVEFFDDGSVEVERFISDGEISDEAALNELVKKYSDCDNRGFESIQSIGLTVPTEYETAKRI